MFAFLHLCSKVRGVEDRDEDDRGPVADGAVDHLREEAGEEEEGDQVVGEYGHH